MKKHLPACLLLCVLLLSMNAANAQSKLIHYWNFNTASFAYYTDTIHGIPADYSTIDVNKAQILYKEVSGTSASYSTYIDTVYAQVTDCDTINARMGATPGIGIRARNPSDSMELYFYIPTNHYKNIVVKYATESSSVKSGQLHQMYAYSTDSGKTWKTTDLSTPSDSAGIVYGLATINFGSDTTVNDNPGLVFKITFVGNTTGTKGNNRFDNVTVEGDTIMSTPPPPPTSGLIHYWSFNHGTLTDGTVYTPHIAPVHADYSTIDINKAQIWYKTWSATPLVSDSTYLDSVSVVAGSPDFDTVNARFGEPSGAALRARNPSDSFALYFYIPTTNYKNIVLKFASESSSTTHGMLHQLYDYSVDSGKTWKTTALSETTDSAWLMFHLITVSFNDASDSFVKNNPKLVFRIKFQGNTTGTSGNNRFDNITVEGDTCIGCTMPTAINNISNTTVNICTLYPNPTNGQLYISTPSEGQKAILIMNVEGQRVYAAQHNEKLVSINVAQFTPGMYYVNVHDVTTGNNYTMKFVKQ